MSSSKIVAVIGSGDVGRTLANGFLKHGYRVILASRDLSKLTEWLQAAVPNDMASVATFSEAAAQGDIVVLAVGGGAAVAAVELIGIEHLKNKTVIDATNPLDGTLEEGS